MTTTIPTPARHHGNLVWAVLAVAGLLTVFSAIVVSDDGSSSAPGSAAITPADRTDTALWSGSADAMERRAGAAAAGDSPQAARHGSADAAERASVGAAAAAGPGAEAARHGSADAAERSLAGADVTAGPGVDAPRYGSADAAERQSQR